MVDKVCYLIMLAGAEGFAPAGTTKWLSDRPLETFGAMLAGGLAGYETGSFFFERFHGCVVFSRGGSSGDKMAFWILQDVFSFGAWLRRPGGQGGFRPPPYAPLDPLYPLQTAEGYPRTPLVPEGARPLVSRPTGSVSGPTFGLAWGQQPIGSRNGHAPCMAPMPGRMPLHGGTAVAAPCRHSKDKPVPWSRGRDQLRRRRQWPSQGRT